MKIINSTHNDLFKITNCHRKAFSNSFSSKLGYRYCKKMLEWYLSTDKAFLFHLKDKNSNCLGYCGAIINDGTLQTGSSSAMTQYSFKQGMKSLLLRPWLFFHKEMYKNYSFLIKNIKVKLGILKPKRGCISKNKLKKDPYLGLVVIGVNPLFQGKGYGSKLLLEFEKRARKLNINKLSLSVKTKNLKAIRAYEKNGWVINKKNEKTINMIKVLS